jgi:hypothetical protein
VWKTVTNYLLFANPCIDVILLYEVTAMDLNTLQQALKEAQDGLKAIDADFEMLRVQKERLERLIVSLREVMESSVPIGSGALALATATTNQPEIQFGSSDKEPAIWESAVRALTEAGRPLTVPEITSVIKGIYSYVISPESVRVAMFRKPNVFSKMAYGSYGLKAWKPEEEKEAPIAEAS